MAYSIPFGVSIHHFISSVGADAGFASLIGLALLVLLYFAHARETATLRARADEAGLRVEELEVRVADLAEQLAALPAEISVRPLGAPAAAHGGVQQGRAGAPVGAGGLPPAAPAGVAAPALAAATRLIPMPAEYEPVTAGGGANGAGHPEAVAATAGRPVPAAAGVVSRPAAAPPRTGASPPRTGAPSPRTGAPPPRGSGPSRLGAGAPGATSASRPPMPLRPVPQRSRTGRVLAAIVVAVLAAAAIVAGIVVLTRHSGASSASKSSANSTLASHRTSRGTVVSPSTVTVTVLNGTDMQGLAGRVLSRLVGDGYRQGTAKNASDQTQTNSVVAYMAPSERRDALAVAASLKLTQASVQPVDAATKAIACPPAQACTTSVVVTVGSDLAAQ
jgi:hypothetical protein